MNIIGMKLELSISTFTYDRYNNQIYKYIYKIELCL
jgi:hypothetical protein